MFAIISDIHSNLEALTMVLADIEKRGIERVRGKFAIDLQQQGQLQ
ncbi:unnamed protein product [marine sediment metagenome]|uniref:Uncharacterized protein n=1 Tax=marine sediment metagenome TaxID=412755 RepID=X1AH01_9ZZZZ